MAKCKCPDCTQVSPGLLQCQECGTLWQDDPEGARRVGKSSFRLGMEADRVRHICRRTGRQFVRAPEPINYRDDPQAQLVAQDLKVRWDMTDGLSLYLARLNGSGPFLVYKIELRGGDGE